MRTCHWLQVASLVCVVSAFGCSSSVPDTSSPTDDSSQTDDSEIKKAETGGIAAVGREMHRALRELAPKVTLGFLGEDSGSYCTASFRVGPSKDLSAEETLRLFGFNAAGQLGSDTFDFEKHDAKDKEFWDTFTFTQDDPDAAAKVTALLSGPNVVGIATMVVEDHRPFGAPAFLVARMSDNSLVALRGTIGGMSL